MDHQSQPSLHQLLREMEPRVKAALDHLDLIPQDQAGAQLLTAIKYLDKALASYWQARPKYSPPN